MDKPCENWDDKLKQCPITGSSECVFCMLYVEKEGK